MELYYLIDKCPYPGKIDACRQALRQRSVRSTGLFCFQNQWWWIMKLSISASTNNIEAARALRANPIPGVRIIPFPHDGIQCRSLPQFPININFNIDIDPSLTRIAAVVGYIVGRCRGARSKVDLHINGKKISSDDPGLIEAELEKHCHGRKEERGYN